MLRYSCKITCAIPMQLMQTFERAAQVTVFHPKRRRVLCRHTGREIEWLSPPPPRPSRTPAGLRRWLQPERRKAVRQSPPHPVDHWGLTHPDTRAGCARAARTWKSVHSLYGSLVSWSRLFDMWVLPEEIRDWVVLKDELEKVFPRTSPLADSGFTFMRQNTEAFGKTL